MRSVSLIALLLTLGCAEKAPPLWRVEGPPVRPWAGEGVGRDVKESIASSSAADLDGSAREEVRAMHLDASAPTTEPEVVEGLRDFSAGQKFVSVYGSTIFGDPGKGEMYLLHAGVGGYFADYQSVQLDGFGGYVRSGIDDNGGVAGLDAVYRNHFLRADDDDWTIYFEGGLGLQQASTNFSGERHFNFRIRLGFGASFEINEHARLFVGGNYQHISDAGIDAGIDAGGGFDGPMLYAGVTFPF